MRKFVEFVNVTVAVLAGAYMILFCFMQSARALPYAVKDSWLSWFIVLLIGLALVGLNVGELRKQYKAVGFGKYLRITTTQGTTSFFVPTLEMQLQRELRAEPDIVDPIVVLTPGGEGKPMRCEVELKLRRNRDGKDGVKRIDEIKKRVRDIIDRLISGALTVEVLVDVRDFVNESVRSRKEILPDAAEFNGPVYTDGGGSEGV